MELEKAYKKLQRLAKQAKGIAESVKPHFGEYGNPFELVSYSLKRALLELRKTLIERTVREFRYKYTPNLKPDIDFHKLMNEKAGEDGFRRIVIERWFKRKTKDTETLKAESLKHLKHVMSNIIPYGYHMEKGREVWGSPKRIKEFVEGKVLTLHVYTWDSGQYGGLKAYHSADAVKALEKVIEVATLRKSPIDVEGNTVGLSKHMTEDDPERFYRKVEVTHKAVQSFRFFKKGTVKIQFKKESQARKVARLLLN